MHVTVVSLAVMQVWLLQLSSSSRPVKCLAGTFWFGDSGEITCIFNIDINATQHNFNIVKYPLIDGDNDADSGTYVLLCNWGRAKSLECKVEDGYTFRPDVSNHFSLSITNVTTESQGQYMCQLVPDEGVGTQPCSLKIANSFECIHEPPLNNVFEKLFYIAAALLLCLLAVLLVISVSRSTCSPSVNKSLDQEKPHARTTRKCCHFTTLRQTAQHVADNADNKDDAKVPLTRIDVNSQPNTVNKTTKGLVTMIDKHIQIGQSVVHVREASTQVRDKDIPKENEIKKSKETVVTGSSVRYNNPQYAYIQTPPEESVPSNSTSMDLDRSCETAVSIENRNATEGGSKDCQDSNKDLRAGAQKLQNAFTELNKDVATLKITTVKDETMDAGVVAVVVSPFTDRLTTLTSTDVIVARMPSIKFIIGTSRQKHLLETIQTEWVLFLRNLKRLLTKYGDNDKFIKRLRKIDDYFKRELSESALQFIRCKQVGHIGGAGSQSPMMADSKYKILTAAGNILNVIGTDIDLGDVVEVAIKEKKETQPFEVLLKLKKETGKVIDILPKVAK